MTIMKDGGLSTAEIVYLHTLELQGSYTDAQIRVRGFSAGGQATGYHFYNARNQRCCNVTRNPITDGIVLTYGQIEDYDFPSKQALDTAIRMDFGYNQHLPVAQQLLGWLTQPLQPYRPRELSHHAQPSLPPQEPLDAITDRQVRATIELALADPPDSIPTTVTSPSVTAARAIVLHLENSTLFKGAFTRLPVETLTRMISDLALLIDDHWAGYTDQLIQHLIDIAPTFEEQWRKCLPQQRQYHVHAITKIIQQALDEFEDDDTPTVTVNGDAEHPRRVHFTTHTLTALLINRPRLADAGEVQRFFREFFSLEIDNPTEVLSEEALRDVITIYRQYQLPTLDNEALKQFISALDQGYHTLRDYLTLRHGDFVDFRRHSLT